MDFLSGNSICGQTLLHLVAKGNSILAELFRLSGHIPKEFRIETKAEEQKYGEVLPNFCYLNSPKIFEKKISSSAVLKALDDEIYEIHSIVIDRIYAAFESIYRYAMDLIFFLDELNDGIYVQQTIDSIFNNRDGKQLMCEMLYIYGVMLLIVDQIFPGDIRERFLVSYYRHSGQKSSSGANIDDVCKLLRSSQSKKQAIYPQEFFKSIPIDQRYIDLVIGYLRSDDIYHQVDSYPSPDHRTTALATQASMLYVCLYFKPSILMDNTSRMREIVDKFFSDNWVISFYMGWTVNLFEAWDSFKASKQALYNTLVPDTMRQKASSVGQNLKDMLKKTAILCDEPFDEAKVINNSSHLLNVLRECNVSLRWLMLHQSQAALSSNSHNKKIIQAKNQGFTDIPENGVYELLLNSSIVELSLSDAYKKVLQDKKKKWQTYKEVASRQSLQLSEVFSGSSPLIGASKNDGLQKWFKEISEQISNLDLEELNLSRQKIMQIIQAMRQVQEFHNLHQSAGVIQAIEMIIHNLESMSNVSGINEDDMVSLALISDLSYAWKLIDEYTGLMQKCIKKDPSQVGRLRAAFLKLASGLELPLIRINQAKSPDIISVSAYYSGLLVDYIKKVLQVIPESMFEALKEIAFLQTTMKPIPIKLDKEKILDFVQLDERYEMAKLTHRIAVLGEGVSMMKTTLVGVVQIDPKELLQEGIQRELVLQLSEILHNGLIFSGKTKTKTLKVQLDELSQKMQGFQRSFEYIQDYLNIFGLKIWQQQLEKVITFNVDQECHNFMGRNVSWTSDKSMPNCSPLDGDGVSFMGRLLQEILRNTNAKTTVFVPELFAWFDTKTHKQKFSLQLCQSVVDAVGVAGLMGLLKMISFLITQELQDLLKVTESFSKTGELSSVMDDMKQKISPPLISQGQRMFSLWVHKCGKILVTLLDKIQNIGRMQLLQNVINYNLSNECKLQSKVYTSVLKNLEKCFLSDIKKQTKSPENTYPDKEGHFTKELIQFLERSGNINYLDKVYITPKPFQMLPEVLLLLIVSNNSKIYFSKDFGSLISIRGNEGIDGSPFIYGIITLIKQFHPDYYEHLLKLLSQYCESITANYANNTINPPKEPPQEVVNTVFIIKELLKRTGQMQNEERYISPHLRFVSAV